MNNAAMMNQANNGLDFEAALAMVDAAFAAEAQRQAQADADVRGFQLISSMIADALVGQ